ncbi:MAG: hypothetical protein ACREBV_10375 [Candidatus Zixiibacteriota bacterium]
MKKSLFVIILALCSCGGPKMDGTFPSNCKPYGLTVEVDSGKMIIKWRKVCRQAIGGYNIYISEKGLSSDYGFKQIPKEVSPFNPLPFPGDTNPEDSVEVFEAEGLTDGIKYFVSVRILLPNGIQSRPTNEVLAVTGPSGEIELSVRFKSERDGYSFATEKFVRADNEQNDLYFYQSDGVDYLASPKKLNGFLKDVRLMRLPFNGRLEEIKAKVRRLESQPTEERISVITGDWIWAKDPDNSNTLFQVLGFTGEGDNRKIRLFYLHSLLQDELLF